MMTVELDDEKGGYEKLAGIHKVAIPLNAKPESWDASMDNLLSFLERLGSDDINFSVSVYGQGDSGDEGRYEEYADAILSIVREAGLRKANLVRPRSGTEVLARDVVSRKVIDFIVLRTGDGYWVGVTSFIPDTMQFQERSNNRPVVSSDITMSSRLARLLINIGGVQKGNVILDPFCGSGTILAEALLVGADCIGVDREPARVENTKRNLEWTIKNWRLQNRRYDLKVGDATRLDTLMTGKVDAVVTEPIFLPKMEFAPDLEKARKLIRNSSRLYSEALYALAGFVRKGGRVAIVAPALRSSAGRDVSVLIENVEEIGLRPLQPPSHTFDYPVKISNEKTRWVKRMVYAFERV